jgi:hypothetical protein
MTAARGVRGAPTGASAKAQALRSLRTLPNVGKSIAVDLWDLDIRSPDDLKGQDPEALYQRLCRLRGTHIDRCMLYVLRAVVYWVTADKVDSRRAMWWHWKDGAPAMRGLRR